MEQKYSLFQTEKIICEYKLINDSNISPLIEPCFRLLETFDDLEELKIRQKEYDFKTIIIPTF
jgi:hypothetical protein